MLLEIGVGGYLNSQIEQADLSEKYYLKSLEIMSSPHLELAPLTYYRSFICQPTKPSAYPWLEAEDFGESCSPSIRRRCWVSEMKLAAPLVSRTGPGVLLFRSLEEQCEILCENHGHRLRSWQSLGSRSSFFTSCPCWLWSNDSVSSSVKWDNRFQFTGLMWELYEMVYGTALTDKIHPHPISFAHSMALSTSPHGILSRKSPLSLLPSSFLTFWAVAMIGGGMKRSLGTPKMRLLPFWVLPVVHEPLLAHSLGQTSSLKVPSYHRRPRGIGLLSAELAGLVFHFYPGPPLKQLSDGTRTGNKVNQSKVLQTKYSQSRWWPLQICPPDGWRPQISKGSSCTRNLKIPDLWDGGGLGGVRRGLNHREGPISQACWVPTSSQTQPRGTSGTW